MKTIKKFNEYFSIDESSLKSFKPELNPVEYTEFSLKKTLSDLRSDYDLGLTYFKTKIEDNNGNNHYISVRMNKDHSWNKGRNNDVNTHSLSLVNDQLHSKDLMDSWIGQDEFYKPGIYIKQIDNIKTWEEVKYEVTNFIQEIQETLNSYSIGSSIFNEHKNQPTNKNLWDKALRLVKGTRHGGSSYVTVDGKRYDSPNDGKGFEEYPSAYSNSFAAKMYKKWGGNWKKVNEDLRKWHKEKWVRINTTGEITGECGTMKDKDNPSRCLPEKKAKSMTKKERAKTAKKKKRSDKKYVPNTEKAKVTKKDRK